MLVEMFEICDGYTEVWNQKPPRSGMKRQDEEADQFWMLIETLNLSQLDVRMNILLDTQL